MSAAERLAYTALWYALDAGRRVVQCHECFRTAPWSDLSTLVRQGWREAVELAGGRLRRLWTCADCYRPKAASWKAAQSA